MDHLFSIKQVKVIILKSVKAHQANQINQMKLQLVALLHHSCIKAHQINFSLLLVYCFRQLVFLKASNHLLKVNLLKFTARSPHHLFLMLIFPLILEKNLLFSQKNLLNLRLLLNLFQYPFLFYSISQINREHQQNQMNHYVLEIIHLHLLFSQFFHYKVKLQRILKNRYIFKHKDYNLHRQNCLLQMESYLH